MSVIILVYYSLYHNYDSIDLYYDYTKFPPSWMSSRFEILTNNDYQYIDEFKGDLEYEPLMLIYLHNLFNYLHNKKIVSRYTFKLL